MCYAFRLLSLVEDNMVKLEKLAVHLTSVWLVKNVDKLEIIADISGNIGIDNSYIAVPSSQKWNVISVLSDSISLYSAPPRTTLILSDFPRIFDITSWFFYSFSSFALRFALLEAWCRLVLRLMFTISMWIERKMNLKGKCNW